jgi:hypothetical protein
MKPEEQKKQQPQYKKSDWTKGPQQGKAITLKIKDSAFKNLHLKKKYYL